MTADFGNFVAKTDEKRKSKDEMNRTLKFGLSEKHTKFEKIFLMVLTNQLIYLVNVKTMRKIFSNYVCFSKSPNFKKV